MSVAVHFGAGNIGRGFVGLILHRAGYEVVFVDVVDALIDGLNRTPSYLVKEVGLESDQQNPSGPAASLWCSGWTSVGARRSFSVPMATVPSGAVKLVDLVARPRRTGP